ncbi:DHA2 family efflux MFS transporter permease subunit [Aureimonas endophytica]|nr:DHA2 family efflux MFS transporter permease subunit [Aureimonas endophytica]
MTAEPNPPTGRVAVALGFGAMCLGMFMAILDIQIVATSLPTIQSHLRIEPDDASWMQTAYLIAEIVAIPLTGPLEAVLGLRRLFAIAVLVFTLASCGCAASGGFAGLVSWRVLQGFSGGMLIPLVFAAVFILFEPRRQSVATTVAGVLAVLAPTVGPIAGGWMTSTFSWHWLFLVNVVPGLLATLGGWLLLPRMAASVREWREIDLASVAMLGGGLAALVIALKEAPRLGWTSSSVILEFSVAAALGASLLARCRRTDPPLLDLSLFRQRNFAFGCVMSFVLGIALFGSVYLMPVFLAYVRGHDAFAVGRIMLATGLAQLLSAPVAVALEPRVDARLLTGFGFVLLTLGLWASGGQSVSTDAAEMVVPQVLRGTAFMFCLLPPTRLALGNLPEERVAAASGLFNLMRNLGGAIGLALIDTVIYGGAPRHAEAIVRSLRAGDAATAEAIGLPGLLSTDRSIVIGERAMTSLLQPLVRRAALTETVNSSWLLVGALTATVLLILPFARPVAQERSDRDRQGER